MDLLLRTLQKINVSYGRKSTDEKNKQIWSLGDQDEANEQTAKSMGEMIHQKFEEAISGKIPFKRKEFRTMMDLVWNDRVKYIFTWKLNRLARNPMEAGEVLQALEDGKVIIVTPEKIYTSRESVLMPSLEFAMAHQYSKDLAVDVRRRQAKKLAAGVIPGHVPEGWKNCPVTRGVIIDSPYFEQRCDVIRTAIDLKWSLQDLANYANNKGYRSRNNKLFTKQTIKNYILNPFNYGAFWWAGELYKGSQPTINTFQEHLLLVRTYTVRKNRKIDSIYNGLMKCGKCGSTIIPEPLKKGKYKYWRCNNQRKCKQKSIEQAKLEAELDELFGEMYLSDKFTKWSIRNVKMLLENERKGSTENTNRIKQQLGRLDAQIDSLTNLMTSPENSDFSLMSLSEFRERKNNLTNQKIELTQQLQDNFIDDSLFLDKISSTLEYTSSIKRLFNEGDREVKRQLVQEVTRTFNIRDGKINVELLSPFKELVEIKRLRIKQLELEKANKHAALEVVSEISQRWLKVIDVTRTFLSNTQVNFHPAV